MACPVKTAPMAIDPIIEVGEDSSSTVCNMESSTCRAYGHFIWIARTSSALAKTTAGAFFQVNGGAWAPAPSSATIFQGHTLPPAGALGNSSMVFSTQFDSSYPDYWFHQPLVRTVCMSPWVLELHDEKNDSYSCGQIMDFPCLNLSLPSYEPSSEAMAPTFKFANWSMACTSTRCRAMGHFALNANPLQIVTAVTVLPELAWASNRELLSPTWAPNWAAAGKADWLSVFDQVNTSAAGTVKSQRFHVAFDEWLPAPPFQNQRYACVRFSATDDVGLESANVDMNPIGYVDSKFCSPSVYVHLHRMRCYDMAGFVPQGLLV